jgi:hypothetical protein
VCTSLTCLASHQEFGGSYCNRKPPLGMVTFGRIVRPSGLMFRWFDIRVGVAAAHLSMTVQAKRLNPAQVADSSFDSLMKGTSLACRGMCCEKG